jgi:uncharacterized protein YbjT (DUF2867 family)
MTTRFAVAGVTGNTGSIAAARLLDAGQSVRVIVRDISKGEPWAARGAEVAVADLNDAAALERVLAGVEGTYLLSPPDATTNDMLGDARRRFRGYAKAVRGAGVRHGVLLSSIGVQQPSGTGPVLSVRDGEEVLAGTGAAVTFIRAAYFMENWGAVLPAAKAQGVLPSFIPASQAIPMVAALDIGAAAAQALLDGPRARRVIELSGPVDVSPNDVAAALTRLLGRSVSVVEAPLEAAVPTFTSLGFSANVAGLYRDMYEAIQEGRLVFEGRGAEQVRGPTGIDQVLGDMLGQAGG